MPKPLLLQLPNTFRAFYGGFAGLHRVQQEAVAPILQGRDLVLQAATGSGKSEAVLAPCLERLIQSGRKTAILYIIPTKALAMDLMRRFEGIITERLGLNLAVRTGDKKRRGGKRPDIMLTTPESLDVMLGSSNPDLKRFLFRVETMIIDEVHAFIYQYRGRHLVYLLNRLERRTQRPLQKIAMSATISRPEDVIEFFNFKSSAHPITTSVKRKIKARLLHIQREKAEIPALVNDLYETWEYRKILIFVNSRVACDRVFGIVNKTGRFKGVSELHYSNLKPLERKKAEKRFRKNRHALCIATSTLELGIDVGDVDAVLLYKPPGSVSAFLQRIGRANRREKQINFWGICAGERSGDQLVRFLALLELSGRGKIETHPGRALPSVLSQQVISCLYEKKRITLPSLQSLFPDQKDILPLIFDSLEKKYWLKQPETPGLFAGGWQYRNHLFEYKIWGNFPEAEVDYVLEVLGKAVADIPQSIVSQVGVGDKIHLAGRLLRIIHIDTGDLKKVMAKPARGQEDKQLSWIGLGPPVSHEVAKTMGNILKTGKIEDEICLLSRTRKLFMEEMTLGEKKVVLENGIEVVPGKTAPFRYRTFLGTMGNLVLERSIKENKEMITEEGLEISSDEIGVESSHPIRFESLNLPVDKEDFRVWVSQHLKTIRSLVPLNLFCKSLPDELRIQELTDFLFDEQVARIFAHYLESSSEIISGDMGSILLGGPGRDDHPPSLLDIRVGESLLEREKAGAVGIETQSDFLNVQKGDLACLYLTATMVSDYFFHAQCHRRLCLKVTGVAPPENKMETPSRLNTLVKALLSGEKKGPVFLTQCLLEADLTGEENFMIKGGGVPDRLIVSIKKVNGKKEAVIEVGDIKSIASPGYHHKWQIAFYALVLENIIKSHDIPARVGKTGFIITRQKGDVIHEFNLKPYLSAFPALFRTMHRVLSSPARIADHRLKGHCRSCEWFFPCYYRALEVEDIQFMPGLTPGELLKLRQMGCSSMAGLQESDKSGFTPEQEKRLIGTSRAFLKNQIFLAKENTRLFPDNISRAFFIHLEKDTLTRRPQALGYQVMEASGKQFDAHVWVMENDQDSKEVWAEFAARISRVWETSIFGGRGPHIFHFGYRSRQDLLEWGEAEGDKKPDFLWGSQPSPWTDLRRVFMAHFYLPAPGIVSLFTLAHVFSTPTVLDPPRTLFHHSGEGVEASLAAMAELYATTRSRLKSQWIREWEVASQADSASGVLPYLEFIKEEQRLQEEDILNLQELSLQERMLKFRAMGHLKFDHTRLDHEGRFLTVFKTSQETCPSKFREGDFLRLAPHGTLDLQTGFPVILAEFDMTAGEVSLVSRGRKIGLSKHLLYSLEEDTSDWNQEKLIHATTVFFKGKRSDFFRQLLVGEALELRSSTSVSWVENWLGQNDHGLNPSQQRALALPFAYRTSMVQGPPGTGKTHLLGWMLIALITQAHESGLPLRIGVTALTHQAIDTVLKKVNRLVNQYLPGLFPGRCMKWGQEAKSDIDGEVVFSDDAKKILAHPWSVIGATGYGFYKLFNGKDQKFPPALDWIIFDEASQVPLPQALLSLIYSKGNFLFLGDVNQLPPIVRGNYGEDTVEYTVKEPPLNRSILARFLEIYPKSCQATLDITYRMNKEICAFPAATWYNNRLYPAPSNAHARLTLANRIDPGEQVHPLDRILDPEKPVVMVVMDHQGCSQKSEVEADLMAGLAHRLMQHHGILPDQMALISPHRAQNNAIIKRLGEMMEDVDMGDDPKLPVMDTVERVQGAERDIIIFGVTSSDPDHILSEFLNSPNRLNVAMTRARTKLIIIGSRAFFSVIPDSDPLLEKNSSFKQLMTHCEKQGAVFSWPDANE